MLTTTHLRLVLATILASVGSEAIAAAHEPTPEEILARADDVRNPSESFRSIVEVKSHDGEVSRLEVWTKGKDKTIVKTLAPKRDLGRNLLMLEQNMWVYLPNLKRAVRVGLSQRLTGEAANGDIARTRWSGDYAVKLEQATPKEWVLYLTANKKGLTYDQIRLTVSRNQFRPTKAAYLTLAGAPLKLATFQGYRLLAGAERPAEIVISDAKRADLSTTLTIVEIEKREFADSLFDQASLE